MGVLAHSSTQVQSPFMEIIHIHQSKNGNRGGEFKSVPDQNRNNKSESFSKVSAMSSPKRKRTGRIEHSKAAGQDKSMGVLAHSSTQVQSPFMEIIHIHQSKNGNRGGEFKSVPDQNRNYKSESFSKGQDKSMGVLAHSSTQVQSSFMEIIHIHQSKNGNRGGEFKSVPNQIRNYKFESFSKDKNNS
ncbi:hypothetical protein Cgig2_008624 [Carnegiea gigantea]|uniref:Uncharacterized protein n=1 Tax=Carnegiea gigantea TaxID=171969 RepID=A0A9Q1K0C8_9CARY|nr:hypothetical protein Cgig2_008624 [Carnegiea gigantea]